VQKDPGGGQLLDVIVVGGSQAGLAIAWHLAQQGLGFVVLEAGSELGQIWRSRWDSLILAAAVGESGRCELRGDQLSDLSRVERSTLA
jgi:cation diffusion facilitator CzcD-associated flavoprotein CzcO